MTTYRDRQLAGKVPAFKHRSIGWHIFLALGEKKSLNFNRLIGFTARHTTYNCFADLIFAPVSVTLLSLEAPARQRLLVNLCRLYQQKIRVYAATNGISGSQLESFRIYSLYSAGRPSNAKPQRLHRRFVAGRTLIWHLQQALTRNQYKAAKATWKAANPNQSWAKYCSTYQHSYQMFGEENLTVEQIIKSWKPYCYANLPRIYYQRAQHAPSTN